MCGAHAALVEGQVYSLHLADLHLPGWQQPLHPAQHLAQEALRLPQDLRPEQDGVRRPGAGGAWGEGWQVVGAHLLQLEALLLQLLQDPTAGIILLGEWEDVAVEAGRGGGDTR